MAANELSTLMVHFINANSAATGGIFATTCTYPLDTINKKQVNAKEGEDGFMKVCTKIIKEDGMGGFFKGLGSKLGWSFGGKFFFYGTYSILQQLYLKSMGHPFTFSHDLLAGYISEWSTVPVALPFEAVATRLQASTDSFFQVVAQLIQEKGFFGLYKGLSAYYILCITPALTNTIFSQVKTWVLSKRDSKSGTLTTAEAFFYGAIARGLATIIMYPYLKAKAVLQSQKSSPDARKETATECVMRIWKEEGFLALYQGLPTELTRGVLSSAVTMMFKERIYAVTRSFILTLAAKKVAVAAEAAAEAAK